MLCRYIKLLKEKPICIRKENIAKSETTPLLPNGTLLIVCMHRKSAKLIKTAVSLASTNTSNN